MKAMFDAQWLETFNFGYADNVATRDDTGLPVTQRLPSSSFLGLPYRSLNMNPKKELLWSLG